MIWLLIMLASQLSTAQLEERLLFGQLARQELITFARLTMPVASDPFNLRVSRYQDAKHHHFIAHELEALSRKEFLRLMLQVPYRHGKTEIAVRRFVPWLLGKFPDKSGIVVTHTDSLAWEHGRDCREVMRGSAYRLVFGRGPAELREDSQARDRFQVKGGGTVIFTGRKGLGGGFGADWIIFDDFFKNALEARSKATREEAWATYISDCKSRLNEQTGWILIIGTRRHSDDVQGRLLDPRNPHYDAREAAKWNVIKLPALAEANDPLERKVDEALWPARFDYNFWDEQRTHASELVREDFQTQGQCNPMPPQGRFFKKDWLVTYNKPEDLPKRLRLYSASDHAITEDQKNDKTVLLPFGVDEKKEIWILPDVMWFAYEAPDIVDAMIQMMRKHRPLKWAAEREHISKAILPFVKLRQLQEKVFGYIEESPAVRHPEIRAWSIRGMMALKQVHFPSFASWWSDAEHELLEFPGGAHDDFVSALSHAGMLLDTILAAEVPGQPSTGQPKTGTLAWVKQESQRSAAEERANKANAGW